MNEGLPIERNRVGGSLDAPSHLTVSSALVVGNSLRYWVSGSWPNYEAGISSSRAFNRVAVTSGRFPPSWEELHPDSETSKLQAALRKWDGRFALIASAQGKLLAATDLLGAGPIFVASHAGVPVVSTHFGWIYKSLSDRGALLEVDPIGFASAAFGSISIDGRTPLEGVSRLQGGAYAVFDSSKGSWDIRQYADPWELTDSRSSQSVLEALEDSVAQSAPAQVLLLTAGLDSYAIGTSMSRRQDDACAASYGGLHSMDAAAGELAARRLNLAHTRYFLPSGFALSHASQISSLSRGISGLQTVQHVAGAMLVGRDFRTAYSGFLGDILSGKPYDQTQAPLETMVSRNMSWARLAKGGSLEPFQHEIMEIKHALLNCARQGSGLPWQRAVMVDLLYRQAHWISGTFDLMNQFIGVHTPFFARRVLEAGLSAQQLPHQRRARYKSALVERGYQSPAEPSDQERRYATLDWTEEVNAHREDLSLLGNHLPGGRWQGLIRESLAESVGHPPPLALNILPLFGLP
jgi:hypothetical protein